MNQAKMSTAQENEVVQLRGTAIRPMSNMVTVAPTVGTIAVWECAAVIPEDECSA